MARGISKAEERRAKDIAKNKKAHQIRWAFSSAVYFTDAIRISPSNSYILYAIFLKKSTPLGKLAEKSAGFLFFTVLPKRNTSL